MSRWTYDAYNPPPIAEEVIAGIVDVILLDHTAALADVLGSENNLYENLAPATKPASGRWAIIRQLEINGGEEEDESGYSSMRFQLMIECDRKTPEAYRWLGQAHNHFASFLIDKWPSIKGAKTAVPIRRVRKPGPPRHDTVDDTYYSTAEYAITLKTDSTS